MDDFKLLNNRKKEAIQIANLHQDKTVLAIQGTGQLYTTQKRKPVYLLAADGQGRLYNDASPSSGKPETRRLALPPDGLNGKITFYRRYLAPDKSEKEFFGVIVDPDPQSLPERVRPLYGNVTFLKQVSHFNANQRALAHEIDLERDVFLAILAPIPVHLEELVKPPTKIRRPFYNVVRPWRVPDWRHNKKLREQRQRNLNILTGLLVFAGIG